MQVSQGNYRTLEDLSHGQKCMVVLMIALAEGDFLCSLTCQRMHFMLQALRKESCQRSGQIEDLGNVSLRPAMQISWCQLTLNR